MSYAFPLQADSAAMQKLPSVDRSFGRSRIPNLGTLPEMLAYRRDPVSWFNRHYAAHGPVFGIRFLTLDSVILVGSEANELVLMNRGNILSSEHGWGWYIGAFFPRGLMLRDAEEHLSHRRVMQTAFTQDALRSYLALMQPEISRLLDGWSSQRIGTTPGVFMFPQMKKLTLDLATRLFMGEDAGKQAELINRAFVDTVRGGGAIVRYPVPGGLWARGLHGRRVLEQYFHERVPRKRAAAPTQDFFSRFCHAEADGERFTDRDVVDHMIFLMMAAHDTTNITLNTMLYHLAVHPQWQDRCRAEVSQLNPAELSFEDLDRLTDVDLVMKESLRMLAPVPALPRLVLKDFEFKGHTIPAGAMVNISLTFTHHTAEHWDNPSAVDPERFGPELAEDKRAKMSYVPFCGGIHKCLGMHFAGVQVKAIVAQLLTRYRLRPIHPDYRVRIDNTSLPQPDDNLPIVLEPLN